MTAHLAEALGTFALVFFGCGAIAVGAETGQLGHPVAGATLGALALRVTLGADADLGVTQPSGSELQALAWEALLTFFLMLAITAVATDTRAVGEAAALAIGGTVALGALVGGPIAEDVCVGPPRGESGTVTFHDRDRAARCSWPDARVRRRAQG